MISSVQIYDCHVSHSLVSHVQVISTDRASFRKALALALKSEPSPEVHPDDGEDSRLSDHLLIMKCADYG